MPPLKEMVDTTRMGLVRGKSESLYKLSKTAAFEIWRRTITNPAKEKKHPSEAARQLLYT
ncbi:MAG: hypothetical protein Q9200_005655 [Gallowayella weberi]